MKRGMQGKVILRMRAVLTSYLLTQRECHTGEYLPEVVAVRTELRSVRMKTTEGQSSLVRLVQARLVSSLLYGALFFNSEMHFRWLALKTVRLLHQFLKFWKNFNLYSFF